MTEQRTAEWRAKRILGITSTDIPAILGISPWKSEGDVAREKLGEDGEPEPDARRDRRLRLGLALEDVVKGEDEREHDIKLRRVRRLLTHASIPWAMASLDFERIGERTIVEVKSSTSRDWDDGLPEYVEAQVRWQMGVGAYPRAHVAALRFGRDLVCFDLSADDDVFDNLVMIAADFRHRLASGGPFAENAGSVNRMWRRDSGAEMIADVQTAESIRTILALRAQIEQLQRQEEGLVTEVKQAMGEVAVLRAADFRVTWKTQRESTTTDWEQLAAGMLRALPEDERDALVGLHSAVRPGRRPFVIRAITTKEES